MRECDVLLHEIILLDVKRDVCFGSIFDKNFHMEEPIFLWVLEIHFLHLFQHKQSLSTLTQQLRTTNTTKKFCSIDFFRLTAFFLRLFQYNYIYISVSIYDTLTRYFIMSELDSPSELKFCTYNFRGGGGSRTSVYE